MKTLFFTFLMLDVTCSVASAQLAIQPPLRSVIPANSYSPLWNTLQPRLQQPGTPIRSPLLPSKPSDPTGGIPEKNMPQPVPFAF